jgi:hypothetical protein
MTIYWSSTKAPVHLFPKAYESEEVAKHITENSFVDAAMLSTELRISHMHPEAVRAYQRRLGVRKVGSNPERRPREPRPNQWTADDLARLKDLYQILPAAELLREFHPRSLKAIRDQASILKLKRDRKHWAAVARQQRAYFMEAAE